MVLHGSNRVVQESSKTHTFKKKSINCSSANIYLACVMPNGNGHDI